MNVEIPPPKFVPTAAKQPSVSPGNQNRPTFHSERVLGLCHLPFRPMDPSAPAAELPESCDTPE